MSGYAEVGNILLSVMIGLSVRGACSSKLIDDWISL